jgi:hypothetical protein
MRSLTAAVSFSVFAAPWALGAGEDDAGWEEELEAPSSLCDPDAEYEPPYEEEP